jgi:hypothetical protein
MVHGWGTRALNGRVGGEPRFAFFVKEAMFPQVGNDFELGTHSIWGTCPSGTAVMLS